MSPLSDDIPGPSHLIFSPTPEDGEVGYGLTLATLQEDDIIYPTSFLHELGVTPQT